MAKEKKKSRTEDEKHIKKKKKSIKDDRSSTVVDGGVKKSRKESGKKAKKLKENITTSLIDQLEAEQIKIVTDVPMTNASDCEDVAKKGKRQNREDNDIHIVDASKIPPVPSLVPFANPLATEKETKRVLKRVQKAAAHKAISRGTKEVVKILRKTKNSAQPCSKGTKMSSSPDPHAIVIIAADISPMDVISHIPVLCEDNGVPYIYVNSRTQLGVASGTKRPTSVVMVVKHIMPRKGVERKPEADQEFKKTYSKLVKLVLKAGRSVTV